MSDTPEPKSHVVTPEEKENRLPEKQNPDITALANLAQEMHREIQKKDNEIAQLNFQLGKYQEITKNSVPLLEARKKDEEKAVTIAKIRKDLYSAQSGRLLFVALFAISLGIIGILVNYLFLV